MKQEKLCESEDMTNRDYSRWYMDPTEEGKFMEELGVENMKQNAINMMQISREEAMQTDPTKVIFPPGMSVEDRMKAMEIMRMAIEAEKARQPLGGANTPMQQLNSPYVPPVKTSESYAQDYVETMRQLKVKQFESSSTKANDRQVGGSHYKDLDVEPWDVIDTWPEEQRIGAYRSGALKYIMRAGDKDPFKQDIAKAHHYLEKLLEILE